MFALDSPITFLGGALKILGRGIEELMLFFFKLVKGFTGLRLENMFPTELDAGGIVFLNIFYD
jgi:hypothetical protein